MADLIGASQPFGLSKRLSYQMSPDRYTGRVLYVTFRTEADLGAWLPPPLQASDPHEGFLKIYQLKRRPENGSPLPPGFSHYHEATVTVLAAPPGEPFRHYNLFMWVDKDWATYKAREALGWPKKIAEIDITDTYPGPDGYDRDVDERGFEVSVHRYGYPIIRVSATLDPDAPPQSVPPFDGFYTIRHQPAPIGGDELRELLVIETRDGWFGEGVYGTGELEFRSAPDEELDLLGTAEVTGCVLRDVGWVLPGWPARRLAVLDPLPIDAGAPSPPKETDS